MAEDTFKPTIDLGETPPDGSVDPAVLVKQVQEQVEDPLAVPPQAILVLIDQLLEASMEFMERAAMPRNWDELRTINLANRDPEWVRLVGDMWRNNDVLYQLRAATEAAIEAPELWTEKGDDGTTWFYREVVGPLIDGQCYGPPVCTDAAIQNYGQRPMPVVPVVARPFVTMRAYGVLAEGVGTWWSNVLKSVGEAMEEFAEHVKEGAKDLQEAFKTASTVSLKWLKVAAGVAAAAVVAYVAWRLTRRRTNPELEEHAREPQPNPAAGS